MNICQDYDEYFKTMFQVCVLLHNKISSLVYNNTFVNVRLYLKYSSTTHTYTYTHIYINIFMYI